MFNQKTSLILVSVIAFSFVYAVLIDDSTLTGQQVFQGSNNTTHMGCIGSSCTIVSGGGPNECFSHLDCTTNVTHNICRNGACMNVPGSGPNECNSNSQCKYVVGRALIDKPQTHTVCKNQACVTVGGAGMNKCKINADCKVVGNETNSTWLVLVSLGSFNGKITNQSHPTQFGQADYICNTQGYPGTFVAWLSNNSVDAKDRIEDGIYENVNGQVIALNKADLLDGSLYNPIGVSNNSYSVWTGTKSDGTWDFFGGDCNGWSTSSSFANATVGTSDKTNALWTDTTSESCNNFNKLYCFQVS